MASDVGSRILPPPTLDFSAANIAEKWRKFKQRFELFLISEEKDKKSDAVKVALFLQCAGEEAIDLYNTFGLPPTASAKLEDVYSKFEDHCNPRKNLTVERFHFNRIQQKDNETFDQFVASLRQQAKWCEFGELRDGLITDRIVIGVRDESLRERLLRRADLNIDAAIEMGRAAELVQKRTAELRAASGGASAVDRVTRSRPATDHKRASGPSCNHCGYRHGDRTCPAQGKRCRKCDGLNHFASCCKPGSRSTSSRPVHAVDEEQSSDGEDLQFDSIQIDSCGVESDWMQTLRVEGKRVTFKLDTGAQANILRLCDIRRDAQLKSTTAVLKDYNDQRISVMGVCNLNVKSKGRVHRLKFFVISDRNRQPILGRAACERLGLVQRVHAVQSDSSAEKIFTDYKDLFTGLGCLPGQHAIDIDESVPPTASACRKVPFALREPLKCELKRMEQLGVIARVDKPTPWVSAIVIVKKKSGKLRVCIDPRPLNKAIKRQHFKLPTREEMIAQLKGAKHFSKLDAAQGFWQLELDDASSHLCTFITPFGRYRYKRLPFGISSAPEVYHKTVSQIFDGLEGVSTFADDIIVWGCTEEEHEKNLRAVLDRLQKKNLKLNKDKCELFATELTFIGDRVSADGVKIDPEKVKVVQEMEPPTNKKELQQFLGMINYLIKWIPDCATKTAPLRQLLLDRNAWVWESHQQEAFERLKADLTSAPVLQYYDPSLPVKISADASSFGLGFVLLQLKDEDWRPVAYGSRSLTDTEKNWAQIERELLAVTVGCEHFHQYLYGRRFLAETDHRPLLGVDKKPLSDCTLRLQRLRLRLQKYDFDLMYTPGKFMYVADALSRCTTSDSKCRTVEEDIDLHVALVMECLPMTDSRLEELHQACQSDREVRLLIHHIINGWPTYRSDCEPSLQAYWGIRHELSTANGLVFRGTRVIVPKDLRPQFLTKIHEGHMGIEKCRRRARQAVYWPNMNADVEVMVKSCNECLKYSASQPREPLKPHDVPTRPFQKVGIDLCTLNSKNYLVIVDYFSCYPEVFLMTCTTARSVIKVLKQTFARFGIPSILCSDNGPQFVNAEMECFARDWGFCHVTSSPYNPKSNGMAESAVKVIKQLLKKCNESNQDLYKGLLAYRNTPLTASTKSPAQLLMGRRLSEPLFLHPSTLTDEDNDADVSAKLEDRESQQAVYNQHTQPLPELPIGSRVRVQDHASKDWATRAQVTDQVGPRSYEVTTSDGAHLRRNRQQLKPSDMCDAQLSLPPDATPDAEPAADASDGPPPEPHVPRRGTRTRRQPERYGSPIPSRISFVKRENM